MSSVYNRSHRPKFMFSTQSIVLANLGWSTLVLLYFILFSAKIPGSDSIERRGDCYVTDTYIFETIADLSANVLCLRNWCSRQIVGARDVWLAIDIGMLCYFMGGIFFGYTEMTLKEELIVSLGDVLFVITYLLLGIGMILAVAYGERNLKRWQWIILFAIGAFCSVFAWLSDQPQATVQDQTPTTIESIAPILNWFSTVSDLLLLTIAANSMLTFRDGSVPLSWRMIAETAFSLKIADIWFKYATNWIPNYQTGEILEEFWVWS